MLQCNIKNRKKLTEPLLKQAKEIGKKQIFKKLTGLNGNPKQLGSQLKGVKTSQAYFSNAITSKQWVEHFSKLLNIENEEKSIFKTNRILSNTNSTIYQR